MKQEDASPVYLDYQWIICAVFLLAFAVRAIFAAQWFIDTPYGNAPFFDAQIYNEWSKQIAAGHVFRGVAFYLSPLYAYLVALLYAIFGVHLWLPSLLNALLGAATCALIARLTFRAFGPYAAIASGILAAFYKPYVFYTGPIMKEALTLFLVALFVNFAYDAAQRNTLKAYFWTGLSLGLCAIVRGNMLVFIPVILGVVYWQNPPARLKNIGFFLLGVGVAILPITLHNAVASHDFVPVSYSDGFNLYVGHNPAATGVGYVFPPEVAISPQDEEYATTKIAARALGRNPKPSEVSRYWRNLAVEFALTHPGREIEMIPHKLAAFWNNDEASDTYDMIFVAGHFDTLLAAPLLRFGFLVFLAVLGILLTPKKHREDVIFLAGFALVYMLTVFPFYVTERFRLPFVVFMLPLAGVAIPAAWQLLRDKKSLELGAAVIPALVAMALTLIPLHNAGAHDEVFDWVRLVSAYEDEGYHVAALEAFNQALAINSRKVWSDAWVKAADAKINLGYRDEGEDLLREAMKKYPGDGSVDYNYGRVKLDDGDFPAAGAAFRNAIRKTPDFTLGYRGLAVVYDHFGDRARAIAAVRQGLAVVPNDPNLTEVMGQLQAR